MLQGSWKYRETCRQGKFDTFSFFLEKCCGEEADKDCGQVFKVT